MRSTASDARPQSVRDPPQIPRPRSCSELKPPGSLLKTHVDVKQRNVLVRGRGRLSKGRGAAKGKSGCALVTVTDRLP